MFFRGFPADKGGGSIRRRDFLKNGTEAAGLAAPRSHGLISLLWAV